MTPNDEHLYDDLATPRPTVATKQAPPMRTEDLLVEFAKAVRAVSRNAVKVRRLCDLVLKP